MKKSMVLTILLGGIIAVLAYDYGSVKAAGNSISPARVAVVNVDMILKNSKKHAQWQNKMNTEESRIRAELEKVRKADGLKPEVRDQLIDVVQRAISHAHRRIDEFERERQEIMERGFYHRPPSMSVSDGVAVSRCATEGHWCDRSDDRIWPSSGAGCIFRKARLATTPAATARCVS